ncbi:MAG: hypothetical protein LC107_06715 [Chitinophagales bacterium]|nr:hypothetical protein [Chitinophagales bacterium]
MHKVLHLIFFVLLSFIHTAQSQDKAPWKWFSPKGEPFEVTVPYDMQSEEKKVFTEVGAMHPVTWICKGQEGDFNHLFMFSYVDYPKEVLHGDSTDLMRAMLHESMTAHLENLNAELVYESTLDYGAHPGIIYRATYRDNNVSVKCRMIIIGHRFYSLQVYCPAIWGMNTEMDRYLMSFRIK